MSENKETQGFIFGITTITDFNVLYYSTLIGAGFTFGVLLMFSVLKFIGHLLRLIF